MNTERGGMFMSKKNLLILGLLSFTLLLSPALCFSVDLPQTGQTACYDSSGNPISCTDTGQDGDLRSGVEWPSPRFTNHGDGTITDNLTGLIWLQDANCIASQYPGFDNDSTSGDGLITWQHALDFINGVNTGTYPNCRAGHGDWRLPNINEIKSLFHAGQDNNPTWLTSQEFSNLSSFFLYWSSTTAAPNTDYAWHTDLSSGQFYYGGKNGFLKVWPVRGTSVGPARVWKTGQTINYATGDDGDLEAGASWPSPRFIDNLDGTIIDNLTGLMWLKDANCINTQYPSFDNDYGTDGAVSWQHALDFINGMNNGTYPNCSAGLDDWRLPNMVELPSLFDFSTYWDSSPFYPFFNNIQYYEYWTSSTYSPLKEAAFTSRILYGDFFVEYKIYPFYVWPVRGGISSDTTPAPFTFVDQIDASLNTLIISNSITVSGINAPAPISITGGEYEVNGNGTWLNISGNVNNGDTIRVRQTSSSNYSTTIDATLMIGGVSDTFSVTTVQPIDIVVTSPNGGETCQCGNTHTIRWSYSGNPGFLVRIELLKGGVVINTLGSAFTNSRSYNWRIPSNQTPDSDYQIRVTSTTNSSYTDTSNNNFTIVGPPTPTISVVSPDGGENWKAGTTQTIQWTYTGNLGNIVRIELLKGGIVNRVITNFAITSQGSYNWRMPRTQTPGTDYTIRITSRNNPSYTDTSDASFTIEP